MMHAKFDATGLNQRVAPFLDWLRAAMVDPHQGITALTGVDLADATLAQQHGIRMNLVPPPTLPNPQAKSPRYNTPFQCKRQPHYQPSRGRR